MDKGAFERTQELLAVIGVAIDELRYDELAFGSWFIIARTAPRRRIVWDGKDHWLYVQQETAGPASGQLSWEDLWVGRDARDHLPELAVDLLVEIRR